VKVPSLHLDVRHGIRKITVTDEAEASGFLRPPFPTWSADRSRAVEGVGCSSVARVVRSSPTPLRPGAFPRQGSSRSALTLLRARASASKRKRCETPPANRFSGRRRHRLDTCGAPCRGPCGRASCRSSSDTSLRIRPLEREDLARPTQAVPDRRIDGACTRCLPSPKLTSFDATSAGTTRLRRHGRRHRNPIRNRWGSSRDPQRRRPDDDLGGA